MARILLTDEKHQQLLTLVHQKGAAANQLMKGWTDHPENLSRELITAWIGKRLKSADETLFRSVIERLRSLEDVVYLTPDHAAQLRAEQKRTKLKSIAFMRHVRDFAPAELSTSILNRWSKGIHRCVPKSVFDFVIREYAKLDEQTYWEQQYNPKTGSIFLTKEHIKTLKKLRQESGISAGQLLKGRGDSPDGLRSDHIQHWMAGTVKQARVDHLDHVIRIWREAPVKLPISDEMRRALNGELMRTGIKHTHFLRLFKPFPEGMKDSAVLALLSGKPKFVMQSHWDYTMTCFQKLPNQR